MKEENNKQQIHICENPKCRKEHDGSYGSGRFCSEFCAHSFVGLNRTIESRLKTSKSVSREHLHICPDCGKSFMHKGTSTNTLCLDCKVKRQPTVFRLNSNNKLEKFCK